MAARVSAKVFLSHSVLAASLALLAACNQTGAPSAGNQPDSKPLPAAAPGETKPTAKPTAAPAANPPQPIRVTVPAGTPLQVRIDTSLSTKTARPGQTFEASLAAPLTIDGHHLADRGARARGVVLASDPGGRVKGRAQLSVRLTELTLSNGRQLALQTAPVARLAPATKKKDALKIGIGSGIGAAIGAIAGGGKGAAIGAGAGAAGGTGVVLGTRGDAAVIPAETLLNFKLSEPAEAEGPLPGAQP